MRSLRILLLAIFIGLVGWAISYSIGLHRIQVINQSDQAEMEWLRSQFHLSDTQFQQIKKLHEDYEPVCVGLCQQVMKSQSQLEKLVLQRKEVTPEIEAALKDCADVKQKCQRAMLGHVYRVSRIMDLEQGHRYIEMMGSRILHPGTTINGDSIAR